MSCRDAWQEVLGCVLHTEAPDMMPNGIDFSFPFFSSFMAGFHGRRTQQGTAQEVCLEYVNMLLEQKTYLHVL